MIKYIEKGNFLHQHLSNLGFDCGHEQNIYVCKNKKGVDAQITKLIADYDPLPLAKKEAIDSVKEKSKSKRQDFFTDAPGKDDEYSRKFKEAVAFKKDNLQGKYLTARVKETREKPLDIANEWINRDAISENKGADISAIEDSARVNINKQTDWTKCQSIAEAHIAKLKAVT